MADDYFDAKLALNPATGNPVAGAIAQVFALSDTGFVNPLPITDMQGVPMVNLIASVTGVYPPFMVAGEPQRVVAKSGNIVTPLTSAKGAKGDKGDDGEPGAPGIGLPEALTLPDGSVPVVEGGVWTTRIGPGGGGREIQLRATSTYIQWRYVGDAAWTNLVALSSLQGAPGQNGTDGVNGASVQMRVNGGYFQYKLTTDTTWTNLVAVGDGASSTFVWMYDYVNNVMPAPPAAAPSGCRLVEVIAPVVPTYASWMGIGAGKVFTRLYIAEG